jgi:hypothetical protein
LVSTTLVANFSTSFASAVDSGGKFANGVKTVNDTGGKFVIGVNDAGAWQIATVINDIGGRPPVLNDTGGKFATGVNDTGG